MKFLELFSGSGILTQTFKEHGHDCMTLDINPKYKPDICCNILDFDISMLNGFKPDVIHASPECRCFSIAACTNHWSDGLDDGYIYRYSLVNR
jgi:site-specific DNA-cytosine methylase